MNVCVCSFMLRPSPYPFARQTTICPMPGWMGDGGRAVDGIMFAVLLDVLGGPMIGSLTGRKPMLHFWSLERNEQRV